MLANREALVELWCERVHGDLSDGRLRALVCGEGCLAFFCANAKLQTPAYTCPTHLQRCRSGTAFPKLTGRPPLEGHFMLDVRSRMRSIEYSPPLH